MFTLYWIDYQSAPKAILDSPSVHTWSNWSGAIFVTIVPWNAPIEKVIRYVLESFLERSVPNVNRLPRGVTYDIGIWGYAYEGSYPDKKMALSKLYFRILLHDFNLLPKNMGAKFCF